MKKLTQKDFASKAKKIHNDKYNYSSTKYKNAITKVKIVCPKHGMFEQLPSNHLRGKGCKFCAIEKQKQIQALTTKQFIRKAKILHENKYDYSLVQYVNNHTKVVITCLQHGKFKQLPSNHLHGKKYGCKQCAVQKRRQKQVFTKKQFVEKAKKVHDNKFDYSLIKYENNLSKLKIICPKHGTFKQVASVHLRGSGCKQCSIENSCLTTKQFIEKAKKIHGNKFDYSLTNYTKNKNKVKIICPKHGMFEQTPSCHLENKGCKSCSHTSSKAQNQIYKMLKNNFHNMEIQKEKQIFINNKKYVTDICFPNEKIVIEYNGDYWHCNPEKYKPDYFHTIKNMTARQIWDYDKQKKKNLENANYKVIIIWENDFQKNNKKQTTNCLKNKINILLS
jgi:very-short-patch-repair endonuclease